jgi:hypothetical protein
MVTKTPKQPNKPSLADKKYQRQMVTNLIESELGMSQLKAMECLSLPKSTLYDWWNENEDAFRLVVAGYKAVVDAGGGQLYADSTSDFSGYCYKHAGYTDVELAKLLNIPQLNLYRWWLTARKLGMMYLVHGLNKKEPLEEAWQSEEVVYAESITNLKIETILKRLGMSNALFCIFWHERKTATKNAIKGLTKAPHNINDIVNSEITLSAFCKKTTNVMAKNIAENCDIDRTTFYRWWDDLNTKRVVIHMIYGFDHQQ